MSPLALLVAAAIAAPQSEFAQLRRVWNLQPADPARPGLWRAKTKPGEPATFVRVDTGKRGELLRSEWSAESGTRDVDLPEETFWAILDGFSAGKDWIETDPDALGDTPFSVPRQQLAQGFRCSGCRDGLVAATWSPYGGTRLLVARSNKVRHPAKLALSPAVTESGIRSLASQQGLSIDAPNPCRDGGQSCSLELVGSRGERWRFARPSQNAPWRLLDASFTGNAWWNPDWDWDSLRIEAPREFRLVLKNWLDAEVDVDGARLLRPIESILEASVSDWTSRSLAGLDVAPVVDRISGMSSPPSALVLCETPSFRLSVDVFGRRKLELLEAPSR